MGRKAVSAVTSALVVGGGLTGTASAIFLAEAGVVVDLVEVQPSVTALGSGITLQGNSLRVLRRLGVLEECLAQGYPFDKMRIRSAGPSAEITTSMDNLRFGGPDLPSTIGMYRPDLAGILLRRAQEVGVNVRTCTSPVSLEDAGDGVDVTFSDGSAGRYGLAVAADGFRSAVRNLLGLEVTQRQTGLGIWRVFAPRPTEVTGAELFYDGSACIYAGYTPTSQGWLYAHITEDAQDRSTLTHAEQIEVIKQLTNDLHGPWDEIRASLGESSQVNYTCATTHVLPPPWNKGRTVVIGDAAHIAPPTIAQGAAMGLEDASVLGQLVSAAENLEPVWHDFMKRRCDRARTVIDGSHQIGVWLKNREQGDIPGVMRDIATLVSKPE
jgi:2-polyprenyl-6-methoxyphenol hydroxylase-like FAD-dependent oxidoreductase